MTESAPRPPRVNPTLDQDVLRTCLRSGNFLPFLGAGAATQRYVVDPTARGPGSPVFDPEWLRLAAEVSALRGSLPSGENGTPSREQRYCESVARSHGLVLVSDSTTQRILATDWDVVLEQLRHSLVSWGAVMSTCIGASIQRNVDCLSPVPGYAVNLEGLDPVSWSAVTAAVGTTISTLVRLRDIENSAGVDAGASRSAVRFHANGVLERVVCLAALSLGAGRFEALPLTDIASEDVQRLRQLPERLQSHQVGMLGPNRPWRQAPASVRLDEAEWFADLLWYTYRYRAKLYPSTRELAFALSLGGGGYRPPTGELAQAAERFPYSELVRVLAQQMSFCDEGNRPPLYLHTQIARALSYSFFRVFRGAVTQIDSLGESSIDAADRSRAFPPMVYTTNFDRGLEIAFEHLRMSHHVLYPVTPVQVSRSGRSADDGGGSESESPRANRRVEWILRTRHFGDSSEVSDYVPKNLVVMPHGDGSAKIRRFPRGESLLGPVIVKLHGSPLDPVHSGPHSGTTYGMTSLDRIQRRDTFQHFVVLPETSYLEAMSPLEGHPPGWIDPLRQLSSEEAASLWFLGYSVSDWNIRLQLYRQVRPYDGVARGKDVMLYGVDSFLDPFRIAFLNDLDVNFFHLDLQEYADRLGAAVDSVLGE